MTGENLWKDYQFLTHEMATFIARQELDMFYELLDQRAQLQDMIEETGDFGYLNTEAGRALTREVTDVDVQISTQLRGSMTRLKQDRQVQVAYQGAYTNKVGGQTDFSG